MVLGKFLIEADVSFGIIVSKDRTYSTQEYRNALVTTGEPMVQILKHGYVLSVFFERLEGFGHFVVGPGLVDAGKKAF